MITYQKQTKSSPDQATQPAIDCQRSEASAQVGNDNDQHRQPSSDVQDLEALVDQIADMLGESRLVPRSQIKILVLALGRPTVIALLRETLKIELAGGMMTADGLRRRTPGGVFFALARKQYGREYRAYMRRRLRALRQAKKAEVPI
jgi:hypothetical protein